MSGVAFLHIFAGLAAITAGAAALSVAKGGTLHRRAGKVFVVAMLAMAIGGGTMAAMKFHIAFQKLNVVAAIVTTYLVLTALLTVRRRPEASRWVEGSLAVFAVAVAAFSLKIGLDALARPKASWFPAAPAFVFATIALGAGLGDVRIALGRTLDASRRIARHLWRMCFALFIATGSLFLGQMKIFPEAVQGLLLAIPAFAPLAVMAYWLVVTLVRRKRGLPVGAPAKA